MKKYGTLSLLLVFTTLLFACKKSYDCQCSTSYVIPNSFPLNGSKSNEITSDTIISLPKATKKDAKIYCRTHQERLLIEIAKYNGTGSCYIY